MPQKNYLLFLLVIVLWNTSCKKTGYNAEDNCNTIQQVSIAGAKDLYYEGDTIDLKASVQPDIALFQWFRPGMNTLSTTTKLFIYPCTKSDQGWYYLHVSYEDCSSAKVDSVYISVQHNPADPPCTVENNTVSFSSIPSINLNSVSWGIDGSYNKKTLSGYYAFGYPDINIYFHNYWKSHEPEDGEYGLGSLLSLDDEDPYVVYITSKYEGLLFQANSGSIFVSHVNGKLRVTFCDINFSGSNGSNSYQTTATGALTAP